MKKFTILFCLCLFALVQTTITAQELNGFKYIYVLDPQYDNNGTKSSDIYGIASEVRKVFSEKGFTVVNNQTIQNPDFHDELNALLVCGINHDWNGWTGATVHLTFNDSFGNIVFNSSGASGLGLSVQTWTNNALGKALSRIKNMRYKYDPNKTPKPNLPEVEMTDWTEEKVRAYLDESTSHDRLEGIYKSIADETLGYYRLGIIKDGYKYKVIVLETDQKYWKPGELKGIMEPASMGVYSVTWYMGGKQRVEIFGQLDARGILELDFNSVNNSTSRFLKMYPISQDTSTPGSAGIKKTPEDVKNKEPIASGTGFAISKDGYIATNAHVVKDNNGVTVDVLNADGTSSRYIADVIVMDGANDVAIIKINDKDFTSFNSLPYTIEMRANVGAEVFTIGFPLNSVMGANYKVSNGIISSKTGLFDDVREYQITVPIQPGNSGGPLFNRDGNVVGITTSKLNGDAVGTNVENVNYAVKSLYLLNAINSLSGIEDLPEKSSLVGKSMEDQIAVLKNFIVLIKIY